MPKPFDHPYDLSWSALNRMKGQAIPLASFHVIRDQVLPMITGEYQNIILYWAGRNLAAQFNPSNLDHLITFFLEMGWGELELERDQERHKVFRLTSPFFSQRQVDKNPATFALECGFVTETIALIENREAEGEYQLVQDKQEGLSIQFKVYLEAKDKSQPVLERQKGTSSPTVGQGQDVPSTSLSN